MVIGAIENRQQIHAHYNGLLRLMCPHVLGEKNGVMHCLFYQFDGDSSSRPIEPGSSANWRCIDIERLEGVEVVNGKWYTADNHSRSQTCVDDVHAEVDY